MTEQRTQAVVLSKGERNNQDAVFTLYTKQLGKIRAVAKSVRKSTSKLSGHLMQGRVVGVRVIDKGSYQLLDALSVGRRCRNMEVLRFLYFLESMTPYNEPDPHIWHIVKEVVIRCRIEPAVYREMLSVMGFAPPPPNQLKCAKCGRKGPQVKHFYVPDIVFLCSNCLTGVRIDENELVRIA